MEHVEKFGSLVTLSFICFFGSVWEIDMIHSMWYWSSGPYTPGFWALVLFLVAGAENTDLMIWPLIVSFFGAAHFYGSFSIIDYAWNFPMETAGYVAIYFVLGAFWSLFRMKAYLREERIKNWLRNQIRNKGQNKGQNKRRTTRSSIITEDDDDEDDVGLTDQQLEKISTDFLSNNKMLIYSWIIYWPLSILHYVFYDLVREVLDYLFGRLKRIFKSMILTALKAIRDEDENKDENEVIHVGGNEVIPIGGQDFRNTYEQYKRMR